MSSSINSPTLDELRKDYEAKAEKAHRYASANLIFDMVNADLYYCKLLLAREQAYYDYKKAEVDDDIFFNHRFAPVINHKIQLFKDKIINLGGVEELKRCNV